MPEWKQKFRPANIFKLRNFLKILLSWDKSLRPPLWYPIPVNFYALADRESYQNRSRGSMFENGHFLWKLVSEWPFLLILKKKREWPFLLGSYMLLALWKRLYLSVSEKIIMIQWRGMFLYVASSQGESNLTSIEGIPLYSRKKVLKERLQSPRGCVL